MCPTSFESLPQDSSNVSVMSDLGQGVSTASDHESVELRRQREEAAQLREELIIQVCH